MDETTQSWINLLKDIGIFGIAATAINLILNGSANRRLERYKQELGFKTKEYELSLNASMEKYKAEISLHLNQQNKLHEKRLLIIDEMYKKLVMLDSTMKQMTAFMKPIIEDAEKEEKERVQRAQDAFTDYNNYFLNNKLYFGKEVSALLEKLRTEYFSANWDYFEPKRLQAWTQGQSTPQGRVDAHKKAIAASQRIASEIPQTLSLLEDEFRKLLGVSN